MRTGFYDLSILTNEQLKQFFTDAVMLAYNVHIDKLDISVSHSRISTDEKTIKDMIDSCNIDYHNFCIDRSIQYDITDYGEIGYSIISDKYFLYIHVTLDNLKVLVDKYNLKEND